jgi:hypothetical protein
MIGLGKGNLSEAESSLREPAELISTQLDDVILRRLWSSQINEALVADLFSNGRRRFSCSILQ